MMSGGPPTKVVPVSIAANEFAPEGSEMAEFCTVRPDRSVSYTKRSNNKIKLLTCQREDPVRPTSIRDVLEINFALVQRIVDESYP